MHKHKETFSRQKKNSSHNLTNVGRHSVFGTELRYGLEGRSGKEILHPSRLVLGPTQPVQWVPALFPGDKSARAWRWRSTPPPSAEVKERVQLYSFPLSGPPRTVLGRTLLVSFKWTNTNTATARKLWGYIQQCDTDTVRTEEVPSLKKKKR